MDDLKLHLYPSSVRLLSGGGLGHRGAFQVSVVLQPCRPLSYSLCAGRMFLPMPPVIASSTFAKYYMSAAISVLHDPA